MLRRTMQDQAIGDISEIRRLLAGTDPGAGELGATAPARLALIREQISTEPAVTPGRRTWWPSRHQRQRRRVVITCMAVPALVAATGAGWALAAQPAASRVTDAVVCYSLPHLPQNGADETGGGGADDGVAPTVMCARQWAAGEIVPGVHRVPRRLAACAVPSLGMIGVFPDTTCAALHLPDLPAGYITAARRFFALDRALGAGLVGSGSRPRCLSEPAAASYIRQTARKHGFASWRIILPAVVEPQLCWQAQADPASHTISVVPQDGVYARRNGPARIIQQVMDPLESTARCRAGSKPESTAAVIRELRTRLRTAGYGNWTVAVVGLPDSRSNPCYVTGGFSFSQRVVDINSIAWGG
jgi:hypothetical protein